VATLTRIINRARIITLLISIVKVERVRCIVVIRPAISAVETTSSAVNGTAPLARPDAALPEQVGIPQIFRWHVENVSVSGIAAHTSSRSAVPCSAAMKAGQNGHRRISFFYTLMWQDCQLIAAGRNYPSR
jgi:hypothetical protein